MKKRFAPQYFFLIFLQAFVFTVCLHTGKQLAQTLALSENLIHLNSKQGETYLFKSEARTDYLPLMLHFVTQDNLAYCGVASIVMVLNALELSAPIAPEYGSFRLFTQDNFFDHPNTEAVITAETVSRMGMTLKQLAQLLESYPVQAQVHHGEDLTLAEFRRLIVENLEQENNFVLVNYLRSTIEQERGGHISPLAAYHQSSDRVLILDVARYKYPPVWVEVEELWRATQTIDRVSGKTRGLVLVNPSHQSVR
ncbi:MAG: glutathione gamma-glutamylcysteinyltransferase [Cyanobacteria bacterium]|jgi:hypothetical protein|nr:glutathione gamma-glutamylcysteinyltransferase [Cyanobacteria bacterium GSL.Bin1]